MEKRYRNKIIIIIIIIIAWDDLLGVDILQGGNKRIYFMIV